MAKTAKEQLGVDLPEPDRDEQTIEAGGQPEGEAGADRPDWLPEQFDTAEDFARSYGELRGELSRRSVADKEREQQLSDQQQRLTELEEYVARNGQAQQAQQAQQDGNPLLDEFTDALEAGDYGRVLGAMQYLAQQAATATYQPVLEQTQQMFRQYAEPANRMSRDVLAAQVDQHMGALIPDWEQGGKQRTAEILEQQPYLLSAEHMQGGIEPTVQALRNAYDLATLRAGMAPGPEPGADQASMARSRKLQAGTLSGGSAPVAATDYSDQAAAEMVQALRGSSYSNRP